MKIKPLYIYTIGIVVIVFILVFFSSNDDSTKTESQSLTEQIPDDDIHKNLNPPGDNSPSSNNVRDNFKQQLDKLKKIIDENPNDTAKVREYAEMLSAAHKSQEAIDYYNKISYKLA